MKPSFAFLLRNLRKAARLTQAQLGLAAQINQRKISAFETDMTLPDAAEIESLCLVLRCTPNDLGLVTEDATPGKILLPRGFLTRFGKAPKAHRPERDVSMRARIHSAIEKYPWIRPTVENLLKDTGFETYTRLADCNSSEEGVGWISLADQGARFGRFSHSRIGWSSFPLMDKSWERCLTGKLWPALYRVEPYPMIFFPQVRVRTKAKRYRLDMNVALAGPEGTEFFGVEVNASGHKSDEDEKRAINLRMPVVILSAKDVFSKDLAGLILTRYREELNLLTALTRSPAPTESAASPRRPRA